VTKALSDDTRLSLNICTIHSAIIIWNERQPINHIIQIVNCICANKVNLPMTAKPLNALMNVISVPQGKCDRHIYII